MPDAAELLAAYDAQLRTHVSDRLPKGVRVERDGPLLRFLGFGGRGLVVYRDLGGLENADLDELIARQVRVFAEREERFEWKLHGHDRPTDLPQRLLLPLVECFEELLVHGRQRASLGRRAQAAG